MPRQLELWQEYSREDVHDIFSPESTFTPQAGTWGLQGMVRVPFRLGDWVFFVTYGQEQGEHIFDESVTDDGVLSWQSQPSQRVEAPVIKELIAHDDLTNNIYLFLRTNKKRPYGYFGRIGYLTHDISREQPVYFQWQILDWPPPDRFIQQVGLKLVRTQLAYLKAGEPAAQELLITSPPAPSNKARTGVGTLGFQSKKQPDYSAQDAKNRDLGLKGELLVIAHEQRVLEQAGRLDLAQKIVHVSQIEGDSAGYDIRSYDTEGSPKFIEVKTTKGGAQTPFFISPNEIDFSAKNADHYLVYRLYEFDQQTGHAKAFTLTGDISEQLDLEPTGFRARLVMQESPPTQGSL